MIRTLAIFLLFLNFSAFAKDIQTSGAICSIPENSCQSSTYEFEPHELPFQLPAALEWQSAHYSEHFYAVILRSIPAIARTDPNSDEPCKGFISEKDRLQIQKKFPQHKVFTSRNGCFPMVYYTNVNDKYNFIAVYAGNNETDAKSMVARAKQAGFQDANLRKMQVVVDNGH